MKRTILALALLSCAALAAHATPGGEGNNTGCNGQGNANSPCAGTPGSGGAGGAGGSATAGAKAAARAEARAQARAAAVAAQRQSLDSTISPTITSTNTLNAAPVRVRVSIAAPAAAAEPKAAAPTEPVKEAAAAEKAAPVVVTPEERRPVNTAYAAPLTSSPETCMGSSSGGFQGASFGVSVGSTWESEACEARMDARALREAGMPGAAVARLCQRESNRKAMEAAGKPCPGAEAARAESILNGGPVAALLP